MAVDPSVVRTGSSLTILSLGGRIKIHSLYLCVQRAEGETMGKDRLSGKDSVVKTSI